MKIKNENNNQIPLRENFSSRLAMNLFDMIDQCQQKSLTRVNVRRSFVSTWSQSAEIASDATCVICKVNLSLLEIIRYIRTSGANPLESSNLNQWGPSLIVIRSIQLRPALWTSITARSGRERETLMRPVPPWLWDRFQRLVSVYAFGSSPGNKLAPPNGHYTYTRCRNPPHFSLPLQMRMQRLHISNVLMRFRCCGHFYYRATRKNVAKITDFREYEIIQYRKTKLIYPNNICL